jgi:hypothetical protein
MMVEDRHRNADRTGVDDERSRFVLGRLAPRVPDNHAAQDGLVPPGSLYAART